MRDQVRVHLTLQEVAAHHVEGHQILRNQPRLRCADVSHLVSGVLALQPNRSRRILPQLRHRVRVAVQEVHVQKRHGFEDALVANELEVFRVHERLDQVIRLAQGVGSTDLPQVTNVLIETPTASEKLLHGFEILIRQMLRVLFRLREKLHDHFYHHPHLVGQVLKNRNRIFQEYRRDFSGKHRAGFRAQKRRRFDDVYLISNAHEKFHDRHTRAIFAGDGADESRGFLGRHFAITLDEHRKE